MQQPNSAKPVILYVIPSLAFGGAEIQALQQLNYLHRQGFEVYLIVLSEISDFPIPIQFPEKQIEVLGFLYSSLIFNAVQKSFALVLPLLQFIQKRQITHVIAHLPLSHWVMRLVKMRQKISGQATIQLIQYHHAIQYEENPLDTFSKKAFNAFNSQLAKQVDDSNIFVSKAAFDNISKYLHIQNPKIIHNAVIENRVGKELALHYLQKEGIKQADFCMVLPGRVLAEVKGHGLLIAAFQTLQQRFGWEVGEVKVIFAGGGRSIPALKEKIATVKLIDFFHFTDFIENTLLLSFLQLADVVVIPSIAEGFGNVAVEGLMQQSTVLCSNAGGLKEIITDGFNGWVFEAGNVEQLTDKLAYLYQHRHEKLLDKNALLEDFRQRFTIEGQKKQLLDFLKL